MILALLLAQATAVDAERAFAADAQAQGQWTAFRKWSTADATMFDPQPVKAQDFLRDRADPPRSVEWKPARSFVSCDGKMAANTGPWRAGAGTGYFSTIWAKQPDGGWRWTIDGGDATKEPKFAWDFEPVVRRAACGGDRRRRIRDAVLVYEGATQDRGRSDDGTLQWDWTVMPDGYRHFQVMIWNGRKLELVIDDRIAAPPPKPATPPTP